VHNGHDAPSSVVGVVGKDDDELESVDEEDTSRYVGNAFQDQMSRYKMLTDLVKTKGDYNFVSKVLDAAIEQLTKRRALEENTIPAVAEGGTYSLLELDTTRSRDKRLLPPDQSLERKGKRR
jgi:hypothetical protein